MFDPDLPPSSIDLSALHPLDQQEIARVFRDHTTVGAALRDLHPVLAGRVVALARQSAALQDMPRVGSPESAWTQWAEAHHVADLLDLPVRERLAPWSWHAPYHNVSVLDAMTTPRLVPRSVANEIHDDLMHSAVDVALALERERSLHERRSTPPAHEALHEVWEYLLEQRRSLRAEVVPPTDGYAQHSIDLDRLELRAFDRDGAQLVLRLDSGESYAPHDPRAQLGLVDRLLDVVVGVVADGRLAALAAELSRPPWERGLSRLMRHALPAALPEEEDKRLLGFQVEPVSGSVEVVQCRPTRKGTTFVTRRVGADGVPEALRTDPRDDRVLTLLERGLDDAALRALIGHPRVFVWLGSTKSRPPVPVRRGRFAVGLRTTPDGIRIQLELDGEPFDPMALGERFPIDLGEPEEGLVVGDVFVEADASGVRVSDVPRGVLRAAGGLVAGSIDIPREHIDALLATLPELAPHLPLDADRGVLGRAVDGDARPLVALSWSGEVLAVSARVQPLPEAPPQPPGEGSTLVCARRGERVVHVQRDLAHEAERVRDALKPLALDAGDRVGGFDWAIGDPQAALGVIERLRDASGLRAVWDGTPLSLGDQVAAAGQLKLSVSSGRDWFGVEGELKVGRRRVSLAALSRAARDGHRYVDLGKGNWIALDEALRVRLAAIAGDEGGEPRLTALHAPILQGLEEAGATVDAAAGWLDHRARLREAATLEVPLAEGLQATLWDYQRAGFTWLARLAHWAPGAVLADDMGLGKTVQTLALLLHRAAEGPALVVAPTSLVHNWASELARFAPDLDARIYHGPERSGALRDLGPGAVLVTTYGVLVNDADELCGRTFATAVLDESQAIKNPATRRAKAAHALDAGFRVALSGTPVENRVAELYSLMGFVAPGLLGSERAFTEHFVRPIELGDDRARRAALAALVAPFVLRRTKGEVCLDLPPRTDTTVRVELGDDELALYERARLDAVSRIQGSSTSFQVLQELTRLRKQACNPRLSDPGSEVPSAKLIAALRILRDLRESGHRALVFSSFVAHLDLVCEALVDEGFRVCRLDGGSSQRQRREAVEAFQAGAADVFLISLKAGGTGLNLTAASYVVHLDPWWNPAAEDQASDRAHRIGQQLPVTVYRLVAAQTVEEQIVALHAHKRELAEALLTGAGSTKLPSSDELVGLLMGSRGDEGALDRLAERGRPTLRLVHSSEVTPT